MGEEVGDVDGVRLGRLCGAPGNSFFVYNT